MKECMENLERLLNPHETLMVNNYLQATTDNKFAYFTHILELKGECLPCDYMVEMGKGYYCLKTNWILREVKHREYK